MSVASQICLARCSSPQPRPLAVCCQEKGTSYMRKKRAVRVERAQNYPKYCRRSSIELLYFKSAYVHLNYEFVRFSVILQQLVIWKRHKEQPQIRTNDRLFWIMLCRCWRTWQEPLIVVKPVTVIRWHRKGFKLFWRFKSKQKGSRRPPVSPEIRDLIFKGQRPVLYGVHKEFMVSCSSWESRSPSEQFPT